jgi:Na+/H+ antiporter NhaC
VVLLAQDAEVAAPPPFGASVLSLVPPVVAIALALVFREVIIALVSGVWLGAIMLSGFDPIAGTGQLLGGFIVPALADSDHASIVIFTLFLGGMVGIISRNGGTRGVVEAVSPVARTPRRAKLATAGAGMAVFFDDYANCLIVGSSMRPITDGLRVSREKLAYLVDSTAAPVAALVPISTWVGYEISLIADGLRIAAEQQAANPALAAGLAAANPFTVFIATIPYRFYPLLALAFVFLTSWMNRDFGPMARAELRAARGEGLYRPGAMLAGDISGGALEARDGVTRPWWNAVLPVLSVLAVVVVGLYATGRSAAGPDARLMDIFGEADPFSTLIWGAFAGCLVAFLLTVGQRLLTLNEVMEAWVAGIKAMMLALMILVLAWSLGAVTEQMGTAQYLASALQGNVPLRLLPALVFLVAAGMSFATGTSWGTMAILLPLVIPITAALGGAGGFESGTHYTLLLGTISSVLAGSIFGDHCSPISDTTILSSTASACDHVDHVRTQLPYALLVAGVGIVLGDIGTSYGLPVWVALPLAIGVLWGVLRFAGKELPGSMTSTTGNPQKATSEGAEGVSAGDGGGDHRADSMGPAHA